MRCQLWVQAERLLRRLPHALVTQPDPKWDGGQPALMRLPAIISNRFRALSAAWHLSARGRLGNCRFLVIHVFGNAVEQGR